MDIRAVTTAPDPVFSEIKMMAYVGISEVFFNSAAMSAFRLGPFQLNVPEVRPAEKPPVSVTNPPSLTGFSTDQRQSHSLSDFLTGCIFLNSMITLFLFLTLWDSSVFPLCTQGRAADWN